MGAHIVDLLLERGIVVVVTARSESKAMDFVERRSRFKDLLEIVVTGDLTSVGAFDDLTRDVDVIIHCASVRLLSIFNRSSPHFMLSKQNLSIAVTQRTVIDFNPLKNDNRPRNLRNALHPPSGSKEPDPQTPHPHIFRRRRGRHGETRPIRTSRRSLLHRRRLEPDHVRTGAEDRFSAGRVQGCKEIRRIGSLGCGGSDL